MDPTNKLFKFAAECEDMAKAADHNNDKAAWRDLAQRWRRCAQTNKDHSVTLRASLEQKRRQPRSRVSRLRGVASSGASGVGPSTFETLD
jgi:hypothetical protein